jgi:hypothetical protein
MLESLQYVLDDFLPSRPWKPVSWPGIAAWLVFYAAFMIYAFGRSPASLFIHAANLVVHEGGHNLFFWFGPTMCLWGGTLLQWLVPFLLAISFFWQREVYGFVFCLFFFFENWIDTAEYMADARAQLLPLVTTGDPDLAEHDFFRIFSNLGVLQYDTRIAAVVRILGWCGMIACVVWLALRMRATQPESVLISYPKPAIPLVQRYPGKRPAAVQAAGLGPEKAQSAPKAESANPAGTEATAPNPQ